MSNLYQNDPINELKNHSKRSKKGLHLLSKFFLFLALAASIGTASYIYYSAKDKPEGEVIVINADNEEIKIKPEDPGGMVVANMDRVIYDTIDGYKEDNQEEVKILPPTEEPIDKQTLIESIKPVENLIEKTPLVEEVIVENKLEEKPSSGEKVNEFIKPTVTAETSSKLVDLKRINEKSYMVQLASFRAKSDAEKEWKNLSRRHAKILSKYQYVIVSKNFEGKGLFYRLQVGPFESESEAVKICKSFKESGINCITVK